VRFQCLWRAPNPPDVVARRQEPTPTAAPDHVSRAFGGRASGEPSRHNGSYSETERKVWKRPKGARWMTQRFYKGLNDW